MNESRSSGDISDSVRRREGGRLSRGADTVPAVMLSPKARNFVYASRGACWTVTVNEQLAPVVIVDVQPTVVLPTGNSDPDAGEHVAFDELFPFDTVGASNVTGTGAPAGETARATDGHEIETSPLFGAVGDAHADIASRAAIEMERDAFIGRTAASAEAEAHVLLA
jgi:hypothetical protein